MSLAKRLRKVRTARGLTQSQLAELVKTTHQSIQKIETGKSNAGRIIEKLADALDVSAAWLRFGESAGESTSLADKSLGKMPQAQYVPILDWVSAGNGREPNTNTVNERTEYVLFPKNKCSSDTYALVIKGDSMESSKLGHKTFLAGEKLIINPSIMPSSGDYVIALINDDCEAVFKQYVVDGPHQYLKPLNPQYPTITINDEVKIIGVVVGHLDDKLNQ